MDTGLAALVQEVELLAGEREHLVEEESEGGLAARVLDGAREPAVGDEREGHGPEAALADEVVQEGGHLDAAEVVTAIEDDEERVRAGGGRSVEDDLAPTASSEVSTAWRETRPRAAFSRGRRTSEVGWCSGMEKAWLKSPKPLSVRWVLRGSVTRCPRESMRAYST
jgi:hypothetical protein